MKLTFFFMMMTLNFGPCPGLEMKVHTLWLKIGLIFAFFSSDYFAGKFLYTLYRGTNFHAFNATALRGGDLVDNG